MYLNLCGKKTFSILHIIVTATLQDIVYSTLTAKANFAQAPSKIVENFKFQKWLQKLGETMDKLLNDLRKFSKFCNFGGTLEN